MKRMCFLLAGLATLAVMVAQPVSAADWYVTTNGTGDGSSWANAASSIQAAISKATTANDTVWVSNGVYEAGGVTNTPGISSYSMTNRISITNAITVRSANNDPAVTTIKGAWDPATNGPAAVRCVYMVTGSKLIGFTLTNGATMVTGAGTHDQVGGGVKCQSTNTVVSNCVIVGNAANTQGGGAYRATLYNCTLIRNSPSGKRVTNGGAAQECVLYNCGVIGNTAQNGAGGLRACTAFNCTIISNAVGDSGGGALDSTLYNCLLTGNAATNYRGGSYNSAMYNCTIVSNSTTVSGGGVYTGALYNCIVYFNTAPGGSSYNWTNVLAATNSCTMPAIGGAMNITNDPMFVDSGSGNWRLKPDSRCVNAGTNLSWVLDPADARGKDLDGGARVRYGIVDIGAYEAIIGRGTAIVIR